MNALAAAIQGRFNATPALVQMFPDGIHFGRPLPEAELPLCKGTIGTIANPSKSTGTDVRTTYQVRLTAHADNPADADAFVEAAKAAYDEQQLTPSSGTVIRTQVTAHDVDEDDERIWQGNVIVEVWLMTAHA